MVVLDRPVWATAAPLLSTVVPIFGPGAMLGPYRIERPLGAGGMGEVFRATDTRLNRRVAIKVLSGGVASDPQLRARFAREAEPVAALTHPHICTLYDVGRHDEIDFLVMEHLEGDTLAARLASGRCRSTWRWRTRKRSPARSITPIATASSIAISSPPTSCSPLGGAKLLDFGLAKFRTAAGQVAADRGAM